MTITARHLARALAAALAAPVACIGLAGAVGAHPLRSDGTAPAPAPTSTVSPYGSHWT